MLERFTRQLNQLCKETPARKYLLTVSGGIDSCVLTHLFHHAGFGFSIAHCNFQLRGAESEADQTFAESLAWKYHVDFHTVRFDTLQYSKEKGVSIQMAARELRYAWFYELCTQKGYDFIVTGHNANDSVETLLLNLSRGTGIRGLMGIKAISNNIIRPLLFATRREIEAYAARHELIWREDASNISTKYHRNKIRHTIIPAFESINPAFLENATETIYKLDQTGKILDFALATIKKEIWSELPDRILIHIHKIKNFPAPDVILFELLRDYGITHLDILEVVHLLDSDSGKQLHTPSHTITHDRSTLIITPIQKTNNETVVITESTHSITHPIHLTFSMSEKSADISFQKSHNTASLDADTIKFPLILRKWQAGDRFHPLGLKGSKKVSDFLTDQKVPLPDKDHIRVIESLGNIVWIVNYRIDDRFRITDQTSKIMTIHFHG
jgi:tRNA(Ile)-lysidine synthase